MDRTDLEAQGLDMGFRLMTMGMILLLLVHKVLSKEIIYLGTPTPPVPMRVVLSSTSHTYGLVR